MGSTYSLHFPSLTSLFGEGHQTKDISNILKTIDAIDTNFEIHRKPVKDEIKVKDTVPPDAVEEEMETETEPVTEPVAETKETGPAELNTTIQYRNRKSMYTFYKALNDIGAQENTIRVLHYGDSQIEGDRITDYLRLKLQAQFGGEGPGLISPLPISQSVINRIETAPGWERYGIYTARDKRVKHNNYGVLAGFSRFYKLPKGADSASVHSSSLSITTTALGGGNALNFSRIRLFYGGSRTRTWCEFYEGPALMKADSLESGGVFKVKEYKIVSGTNKHILKFKGKDSPDFYALSLEGKSGVMVDNIPLRGSSGTFFHQVNLEQLRLFYEFLNVKLIILQFGGNVMPSILDKSMAVNYGNYLRYQIKMIRKAAPNASILFIGPSDMNIKQGTDYVTYPLLEKVRDEIKKAVLDSDCAFFDLYDCMGGRNSMAAWVDQNLAASDYTHFSPQGARKMAIMLYSALVNDYNLYLKNKK